MTIADLLARQAAARPNRPAYSCGDTTLDWAEVNRRVDRLASHLGDRIEPGERVAILSHTCHRYFETHFALARAGLVAVPLNWRLTPDELAAILDDCEARALVLDRAVAKLGAEALERTTRAPRVVIHGNGDADASAFGGPVVEYEEVVSRGDALHVDVHPAAEDLHVIGYTSGTTGRTKGAMVTHQSATISAFAYAQALGLDENDRVLACMPGYVYRGGSGGFAPVVAGAHTVVCEFDADAVVERLRGHRITQVTLAPAMAARVLASASRSDSDFSDLEVVWLTGAPAPERTVRELEDRFGCDVGCLYGMTEATGIAMIRHERGNPDLVASIGRPMPILDTLILDEEGREVGVGEVGEITVRGDTVTAGYWRAPELTAERIRDGWMHTGDMARRDAEGHLFIVDRRADIINSGGLNVYTSQVEEAIVSHPDVVECSVVGAPDDEWGEIPVAVVVGSEHLTADDVLEWTHRTLAAFKRPRRVVLVDELPRNAMGKVDKRSLRDPYWAGRERQVAG